MSRELVIAENVDFRIRKSEILKGISFALRESETVAVIGHNGAGKTTLFHLMLGLKLRTGGNLTINGIDVQVPAARRDLGFVPERPYLNLDESFRKSLRYLGKVAKLPSAELERRIEALAEEFLLKEAIDRPLRTYSKGMLQKTLIAQAILHQPRFLILDEPMSGLDPEAREFLKNQIRGWKREQRTVLFSSHSLEDAAELADRALVMKAGRLTYLGPLSEWRPE